MAKPDPRHPIVKAIEHMAGVITRDLPDHSGARQIQAELNRLRLTAEALDNLNRNRSPLDTPAAHALKVGKRAKAFNSEVTNTLNRGLQIWAAARVAAEKRIAEKVDLKPNAFAQEIRTAFRALDSQKQLELLSEWIKENKGPEMAAIVEAPSFLAGIDDKRKAAFKKAIIGRHAGAELDEIEKLDALSETFNAATKAAGDFATGLTDPAALSDIERRAAEADAADEAFNQSLQQP
jgi:hypothetical protein